MNIKKLLLVGVSIFMLSSCSTKDYSPKNFEGYSARQILVGGEGAVANKNYRESVKYFEAIDALYPFDPEAEQGQLDVIYAYYQMEDYASAVAAADRYIHLNPKGNHTDYAHYMKGMSNFEKERSWLQKMHAKNAEKLDLSNLQDAFSSLDFLIKNFPKSIYAKNAEKHMLDIRNLLAKRELQIAKFYLDRKAYVAAANRASYVVKHLSGTPQTLPALKIMIKSYQTLGANKQANDALQILKLNFPQERI